MTTINAQVMNEIQKRVGDSSTPIDKIKEFLKELHDQGMTNTFNQVHKYLQIKYNETYETLLIEPEQKNKKVSKKK